MNDYCVRCNNQRFVVQWAGNSVSCPACQPPRPKRPSWMKPLGQSQITHSKTPGGGEDEGVLNQT